MSPGFWDQFHVTIKNQINYTRIDNKNKLKWLFDDAN